MQFEGRANPLALETWIREMERLIDVLQYLKDVKVKAIPMLKGNVECWTTSMATDMGGI